MSSSILIAMVAQLAFVTYRWSKRIRLVPFVLGGLAALSAWAVVLLMPIKTHAVLIDMPRGTAEVASSVGAFVPVVASVVAGLLFIAINQLILFGVRAIVNRTWKRPGGNY